MKWFKHDSNANTDAKLKRVRMKYGMQGYGLYWYCLELIAANVEKHNMTFELEHDAEVIAFDAGINYALVQEMMTYMVDLGLFENTKGLITCLKMATRTDEYTLKLLRTPENVPTNSRHTPEKVPPIRIEEKRIDKNKKESGTKLKRFIPPTTEEVSAMCVEMGYTVNPARFVSHYSANGWKVGRNPMKCWKSALAGWQTRDNDSPQQSAIAVQPKETPAQRMRRKLYEAERVIR